MNVEAQIGRRRMCCVRLTIDMTPEELQSVLVNLRTIEARSSVTFNVTSKVFLDAIARAANPAEAAK